MTEKFKIGDRVIFSSPGHWHGVTATVVGYDRSWCRVKCDSDAKYANGDPVIALYKEKDCRIDEKSLSLLPPKEPTDEEIAATLRRSYDEYVEARNALIGRGYVLKFHQNGAPVSKIDGSKKYIVTKTITTVKEL